MADVPVDALDKDAPVYYLPSKEASYYQKFQQQERTIPKVDNYGETLKTLLQRPTIASKRYVYEQFDSEARENTLVGPGAGAAVIKIADKDKAIAISTDCNSRYIYLDPEIGGKIAVAEACRNIVVSGAKPIGITDGLNYGNPTNAEVFWQMEKSIEGVSEACRELNVLSLAEMFRCTTNRTENRFSRHQSSEWLDYLKSLNHITPNSFQEAGDIIYVIGDAEVEFRRQ